MFLYFCSTWLHKQYVLFCQSEKCTQMVCCTHPAAPPFCSFLSQLFVSFQSDTSRSLTGYAVYECLVLDNGVISRFSLFRNNVAKNILIPWLRVSLGYTQEWNFWISGSGHPHFGVPVTPHPHRHLIPEDDERKMRICISPVPEGKALFVI